MRACLVSVSAIAMIACLFASVPANAAEFHVKQSHYTGWEPWELANQLGLFEKWGEKYGHTVILDPFMDYINSITAYSSGEGAACVMTNMECLDMPCAGGITSVALVMGDYSNGNDGLRTREHITTAQQLKGKTVYLVELSVSEYLLSRYLQINGMSLGDVKIENVTDSAIPGAWSDEKSRWEAVVTWNPQLMVVSKVPGTFPAFDSSEIPGEIMDLMVVRKDVLDQYPEFGEILNGIWYETMALLAQRGNPQSKQDAFALMAANAGCSVRELEAQFKTTAMYWNPADAADFLEGSEIKQKMDYVRQFCFEKGLLGEDASSPDIIGIQYPDGTIQGDPKNVQFFWDSSYTRKAANGELK